MTVPLRLFQLYYEHIEFHPFPPARYTCGICANFCPNKNAMENHYVLYHQTQIVTTPQRKIQLYTYILNLSIVQLLGIHVEIMLNLVQQDMK